MNLDKNQQKLIRKYDPEYRLDSKVKINQAKLVDELKKLQSYSIMREQKKVFFKKQHCLLL